NCVLFHNLIDTVISEKAVHVGLVLFASLCSLHGGRIHLFNRKDVVVSLQRWRDDQYNHQQCKQLHHIGASKQESGHRVFSNRFNKAGTTGSEWLPTTSALACRRQHDEEGLNLPALE